MSRGELSAQAPLYNWDTAMRSRGLADVDTVLVVQPSAITEGIHILAESPLSVIKDYWAFQLLNAYAPDLSSDFLAAHFDFHSTTLLGVTQRPSRSTRGIRFLGEAMGDALGQLYVTRYFSEESREQAKRLVSAILAAFRARLACTLWMDEPTRAAAVEKLANVELRVAYPDRWTDYSGVTIHADRHVENRIALARLGWEQELARLNGPVDRSRWAYPPHVVSAYYDAQVNQITMLAGMLQAPFFDVDADAAVNFGAIGAIIGHELSHAFDSSGRLFDARGVLRDWWTPESDREFRKREARLIAQYNSYEALHDVRVDGRLTVSENIADLGGLEVAYTAYQRHLKSCCGGNADVRDGLTGEQRFFLAWAQMWRGKTRPDALRNQLLTNEHSPYEFRVNGVVRNVDAWYEAFGVGPDDELYLGPKERVRIW